LNSITVSLRCQWINVRIFIFYIVCVFLIAFAFVLKNIVVYCMIYNDDNMYKNQDFLA